MYGHKLQVLNWAIKKYRIPGYRVVLTIRTMNASLPTGIPSLYDMSTGYLTSDQCELEARCISLGFNTVFDVKTGTHTPFGIYCDEMHWEYIWFKTNRNGVDQFAGRDSKCNLLKWLTMYVCVCVDAVYWEINLHCIQHTFW